MWRLFLFQLQNNDFPGVKHRKIPAPFDAESMKSKLQAIFWLWIMMNDS